MSMKPLKPIKRKRDVVHELGLVGQDAEAFKINLDEFLTKEERRAFSYAEQRDAVRSRYLSHHGIIGTSEQGKVMGGLVDQLFRPLIDDPETLTDAEIMEGFLWLLGELEREMGEYGATSEKFDKRFQLIGEELSHPRRGELNQRMGQWMEDNNA